MAEFDFEQPVSMEKMRAFRLDRIDEQMRQDGIDCIITMRVDNVRYLTSFRPNSPNIFYYFRNAAVKAVGDDPWALVASGDYDRAMTYMPWLKRKVKPLPMDPMLSVARFREVFQALGLPKGARVGIDEMGFQLYKVFEESFPEYQFVDGRGGTMLAAVDVHGLSGQVHGELQVLGLEGFGDAGHAVLAHHVGNRDRLHKACPPMLFFSWYHLSALPGRGHFIIFWMVATRSSTTSVSPLRMSSTTQVRIWLASSSRLTALRADCTAEIWVRMSVQ